MTDVSIGPSFGQEIAAAGLLGLPFAWDGSGVLYSDELTPQQRADIEAVVAAHDPAPLAFARASRIAALTADCAAAIIRGYASAALGAPHIYPSGITDQINMMGSVTASLLPDLAEGWSTPFWCRDAADSWAFRPHSAAQIQAAGSDGKAHIVACQTTLETLVADVMSAETPDAVAAVVWPGN